MTEPRSHSPSGASYEGVAVLDLAQAPVGQGFMITPWSRPESLFGVVDDQEFPIVTMRQCVIGASAHRFLQVPGVSEEIEEADTGIVNQYYRHTRGEADAVFVPAPLTIHEVALFMEIDPSGEPVMAAKNTARIEAIRIGAIQLAKPLVEGMVPNAFELAS